MKRIYVLSRNSRGRPNLIHRLESYSDIETACGILIKGWSREYSSRPIEILLCKRKACQK